MASLKIPQSDKKQVARFLGERSCFDSEEEDMPIQELLGSMLFQPPPVAKPSVLQEMKHTKPAKQAKPAYNEADNYAKANIKEANKAEQAKNQPMLWPIEHWENKQTPLTWIRQTNMPKIIPRL